MVNPSENKRERGPVTLAARIRHGRPLESTARWIIAAIATAGLYFGRPVLLPIILAILLSFLLAPIVAGLHRLRVAHAPAVLLAVALALAGIGVTSAIIVSQAITLAKDAPAYAERITGKAAAVRSEIRGRFGSILESGGGSGHRKSRDARAAGMKSINRPTDGRGIPVEIRQPPPSAMDEIQNYVVPALEPIGTILIVLIVTIFFLFHKEDLRDRLIRVMGTGDIHRTTVALDEGATRLSRYFLSQSVVNLGFGVAVWGGLFLIGVPSPGLWGAVAGLARFVPYVGVVVGMAGPLALSAAVDPAWTMAIYVTLLFVLLEPVVGYIIEPLLYGHSTGLSPVSVVVAALFWTWIWGPIGLVLSMPVTLMLVVLGRHIPAFEIFDVLLGDRPALSPAETFYQRVLAGNIEGALDQAEDQLETLSLAGYYDEVVLGGLRLAAVAFDRGAVDRAALKDVCETTLEVLVALEGRPDATSAQSASLTLDTPLKDGVVHEATPGGRSVLCISGRGPLDPAVEQMMAQLLRGAGCTVFSLPRGAARDADASTGTIGHADFICMLGLIDTRAYRRIQPVMKTLAASSPQSTLLTGVTRHLEQNAKPAEGPASSLEGLCRVISAGL